MSDLVNTEKESNPNSELVSLWEPETAKDSSSVTEQYIDTAVAASIHAQVKENEEVRDRITEHGLNVLTTELSTQKKKLENKKAKVNFDSNKVACQIYGVDDTVPIWQQGLMKFWYNILFIMYFVVASFTIAPIVFVAIKMQNAIKKSWITYVLAFLLYLAIVGTPMLLTFFAR
jgi:hypothetical protein